jgi:hypothetical protein
MYTKDVSTDDTVDINEIVKGFVQKEISYQSSSNANKDKRMVTP